MLLRRQRIDQPQGTFDLAVELREYATSYLVGSANGLTGDGRPVTFGGGMVVNETWQGKAYRGDTTDNIAYATPSRNFVFGTDKDFTFVVVARKRSAGVDGNTIAGFGSTSGSSGNTLFRLIGGGSANAVKLQAQDSGGSIFLNTDTSDFGWDDLNYHGIVIKGRVAHSGTDNGYNYNFADGKTAGSTAGLAAANPAATTFNVINACAVRRGGSSVAFGSYDVALFLPLIGIQMPDEWCLRASSLDTVWQTCFEPRRIWVPLSAAAAASHDTSGALASDAAAIAGTATHLTLHTTSGALASDAAAIAGAATHLTLHATSGALASDAAVIAGTADHAVGGEHPTEGALSSDAAAIAGSAAHLTLHATSGALSADAATVAGTAAHLTLHATSGALAADAATMAGTAVHSGAGAVAASQQAAGRPSRDKRRPRVVEIDGEDFVVGSAEEAEALLEQAREAAKERAATAVKRAAEAKRRPVRKVVQDARRLLTTPEITAPDDLRELAQQAQEDIAAIYASAIASVEIAALLAKRQREEEDDEDVLLLIA